MVNREIFDKPLDLSDANIGSGSGAGTDQKQLAPQNHPDGTFDLLTVPKTVDRTGALATPAKVFPIEKANSIATQSQSTSATTILRTVAPILPIMMLGVAATQMISGAATVVTLVGTIVLMAASIAADAAVNVAAQANKLTKEGIKAYAASIGLSHAALPAIGMTLGLITEGILSFVEGSQVSGLREVAQALNGAFFGILGAGLLWRFMNREMIEEMSGVDCTPKTPVGRTMVYLARPLDKLMELVETKLKSINKEKKSDTADSNAQKNEVKGIRIFNQIGAELNLREPLKSSKLLFLSMGHPENIKCSIDAYVSAFAKVAVIAGLPWWGQIASVTSVAVLVGITVLAAGFAAKKYIESKKQKAKEAVSKAESDKIIKQTRESLANMYAWGGRIAISLLGWFCCRAAGESLIKLTEVFSGSSTNEWAPTIVAAAIMTYFGGRYVIKNFKNYAKVAKKEAYNSIK